MKSFQPAWWCPGAHAQTIAGAFFRPVFRTPLRRKRIETPDGDFLDIDLLDSGVGAPSESPLVVVLHGLEGSSRSPQVQTLLAEIARRGWRGAAVNMRGSSGEPNRLLQTYHSGRSEDLDMVLRYLRAEKNARRIFLAGFSIGGNIVLKWLGEQGTNAREFVEKAAAISVPYEIEKSVECLDRGFNREVYTRTLLHSLKAKVLTKERMDPHAIRYGVVAGCRTFRVFDREATAPLNGFRDEIDYWTQVSSRQFLKSIRVPTLLVHALDDPFFPGRLLPRKDFESSEFLHPLVTPTGGHLGFVTGSHPWRWDFWLEKTLTDFFSVPAVIH